MSTYYKSYVWLHKRYVTDKMTISEIAKECGVSVQTIQNWLEKFDLIRGARSWTRSR